MGMSPLQGDLNALIASCSEYTFLTKHKRIDGTMYSCTSLGVKIGGGTGLFAGYPHNIDKSSVLTEDRARMCPSRR